VQQLLLSLSFYFCKKTKKLRTSKTFLRENLLIKNFREKIILPERSKFFMIFSHQLTLSPARSSREFGENILKKIIFGGKIVKIYCEKYQIFWTFLVFIKKIDLN